MVEAKRLLEAVVVVVAVIAAQYYDLKRGKKCVKFIFRRFKLSFRAIFFPSKKNFFQKFNSLCGR